MRPVMTLIRHIVSWRRPSVVEQLEEIEQEVLSLETSRDNNLHIEKRLVFRLFFYAFIFFVISLIAIYYCCSNHHLAVMLLYILCYPLSIVLMKSFLCWFFLRRVKKADRRLKDLKERKQKLLEEVMETEVFNKAQQILKRFDPHSCASLTALPTASIVSRTPVSLSNTDVRNRKLGQAGGDSPAAPPTLVSQSPGASVAPTPNAVIPAEQKPRLLRPILPRNRTVVDRIVDAIIGDGPDKRFALICQQCHGHNGMALKEEFEFVAFCCCYCSHHNPSRRCRQKAPVPPNIEPAYRPTVATDWRSTPNLAVTESQSSSSEPEMLSAVRQRSSSMTSEGEKTDLVAETDPSGTESDSSTTLEVSEAADSALVESTL